MGFAAQEGGPKGELQHGPCRLQGGDRGLSPDDLEGELGRGHCRLRRRDRRLARASRPGGPGVTSARRANRGPGTADIPNITPDGSRSVPWRRGRASIHPLTTAHSVGQPVELPSGWAAAGRVGHHPTVMGRRNGIPTGRSPRRVPARPASRPRSRRDPQCPHLGRAEDPAAQYERGDPGCQAHRSAERGQRTRPASRLSSTCRNRTGTP